MINTISNEDTVITTMHPFEGLVNGDERLAKAKLAHQINALITEQGLKQKEASELLGITYPEVSQIAKSRLSGFTFDRLYRCLYALDMDVEIILKKTYFLRCWGCWDICFKYWALKSDFFK